MRKAVLALMLLASTLFLGCEMSPKVAVPVTTTMTASVHAQGLGLGNTTPTNTVSSGGDSWTFNISGGAVVAIGGVGLVAIVGGTIVLVMRGNKIKALRRNLNVLADVMTDDKTGRIINQPCMYAHVQSKMPDNKEWQRSLTIAESNKNK